MPRLKKNRRCRELSNQKVFKPLGIPAFDLNDVKLELDEFEAMRLCDFEDKNQIEASETMEVSRATVQRLLQSGRKKIIDVDKYYDIDRMHPKYESFIKQPQFIMTADD